MAQLVAHLLCKQGVRGSSPLGSTREISGLSDGRRYREDTVTVLVVCPFENHSACDDVDPTTDL